MRSWRSLAGLPSAAVLLAALMPATASAQDGDAPHLDGAAHAPHVGARAVGAARTSEVDPGPIARLRLEARDGAILAWADNTLAGPIEVMLHAGASEHVPSEPALPARATVPARDSALVARIGAAAAGLAGLRLEAVPGRPGAQPRDVEYAWPLQTRQLHVEQGWGGSFSHNDPENLHAVDFAVETGTPVVAARDGIAMQVESGFSGTGTDARYGGRANSVRILHDDGTMAVYAHLDADGVFVRAGDRVRRGQRIGLSGNTGLSSGPHLHFVVQVNRGMRLESIPFRMFGPRGILRFRDPRQTVPSAATTQSPVATGDVAK